MKITIPSRIAPPTAPPEAQSSSEPHASTSTAGQTSAVGYNNGTAAAAAAPSSTRIRIKQGTSSTSNSAQADQASSSTTTQIKLEDGSAAHEGETRAGSPPSNPDINATSSLILPGKRKRTSVTPSNNNTASSDGKLHQHQTRHTANPEEIDKAYADGMKLWQTLRDHQKKDGKLMSQEFMHLPPRDSFPDYYQMIRKPISFSEIRNKIERREYGINPIPTLPSGILKLISDDFKQMFFNAKRYNIKGSHIYNDARKLDRLHRHTYEILAGLIKEEDKEGGQQGDDGKSDDENNDSKAISHGSNTIPFPKSGSATPANTITASGSQQPPKKKYKKSNQQVEEKPITLTKWLSMKVDDLVAMTDRSGRVLSEVFMQVPPQSQYPDYYQIIAKPISFQLVRSRLKNRNYQTIEKFKDDVNLIFTNAQLYNEDGSQIWQDAQQMKEYFNTIMQEEPPEFFVRPRNQSQQAVSSRPGEYDFDQTKLRYGSTSNSIQGNPYPAFDTTTGSGSPFVAPPAQNAYDTVKFGEFDEYDASMDQEPDIAVEPQNTGMVETTSGMVVDQHSHSQSPVKVENVPLPVHQSQSVSQQSQPFYTQTQNQQSTLLQTPSIAVPGTQGSTIIQPKEIAKLVDPSKLPIIKSFSISLYSRTSQAPLIQHHIANSLVRQHTITLSKDVEKVEITPYLSMMPSSQHPFQPYAKITQRQQSIWEDVSSQEERNNGASEKKWIFTPSQPGSIITFEIKVQHEVYRIFLMKLAT